MLFVGLPAVFYFFILDHGDTPFCHKGLLLGMDNWLENGKTDVLPNVGGKSADSLHEIYKYTGDQPWDEKYRYVPGLKRGDPGNLVLMYMPAPTRFSWHGDIPTIFSRKKWLIVPLDFAGQAGSLIGKYEARENTGGEADEMLTFDDFRTRLQKTLDFLRDNNRPDWETIVAEHEAFLKSVEAGSENR